MELLSAQVATAVISILTSVALARLLGASYFGEIAIVMILPNIILLFQDFGVSQSITRWIAVHNSRGEFDKARGYIRGGLIFEILTGTVLTFVSIGISGVFVTEVIGRNSLLSLVMLASLVVIGQSMIVTAKSILIGFDRTIRYGFLIVLNVSLQGLLPILLVLFGHGLQGAITGLVAASLIIGFVSIIIILQIERGIRFNGAADNTRIVTYLRTMLSFGFPLFLSTIAGGLLPQMLYTIAARNLSSSVIGNYAAAVGLGGIMLFISSPIITILFPAFSKIDAEKNKQELRDFYLLSVKYTSILVVPIAALLSTISYPFVVLLYGPEFQEAQLYFILSLIPSFYVVLGGLVIGGLLKGQGYTMQYLSMHIVQLGVAVCLAYYLTFLYGIIGLFTGAIIGALSSITCAAIWVWRKYGILMEPRFTVKILFVSSTSILVGWFAKNIASQASILLQVLIGTLFFGITFLLLFAIFEILDHSELEDMRKILEEMGILATPIVAVLSMMDKLHRIIRGSGASSPRDEETTHNDGRSLTWRELSRIRRTMELVPEQASRILEVGCKDCRMTNMLVRREIVVGLDLISDMMKYCNSESVQASAESIPFKSSSFDCVICTEVLEHLPEKALLKAASELQRMAGKWILVSVPLNEPLEEVIITCKSCGHTFQAWGHRQKFTSRKLKRLLPNFKPEMSVELGKVVYGSRITRKILYLLKEPAIDISSECPSCGASASQSSHRLPELLRKIDAGIRIIKGKAGLTSPIWIVILFARNVD